jgi:DNA uptake protein ComE-like DNA-binding protein
MWDTSTQRLWALLACLLLCFSVTAQTYTITEAELMELETALQTAKVELSTSAEKLTMLQAQLQTLQSISTQQAQALIQLSESFNQFVEGGQRQALWLRLALIGTSGLCVVLALK